MPQISTGTHSPESLRNTCERAREFTERLEVVAKSMETRKIESLEITHQDALLRGMKLIEKFADAAGRSYRDWLEQAGMFTASTPPKKKKGPK